MSCFRHTIFIINRQQSYMWKEKKGKKEKTDINLFDTISWEILAEYAANVYHIPKEEQENIKDTDIQLICLYTHG